MNFTPYLSKVFPIHCVKLYVPKVQWNWKDCLKSWKRRFIRGKTMQCKDDSIQANRLLTLKLPLYHPSPLRCLKKRGNFKIFFFFCYIENINRIMKVIVHIFSKLRWIYSIFVTPLEPESSQAVFDSLAFMKV